MVFEEIVSERSGNILMELCYQQQKGGIVSSSIIWACDEALQYISSKTTGSAVSQYFWPMIKNLAVCNFQSHGTPAVGF
jgi:hypothetical protein